ncbi:hypothetical protein [Minwuia thermotolerans]|uniref:Uncharacterized protein n=1 Tax=Minwuia thermotolerans TaxID=2056226 RepID=A0A2M9FVG0_9PROT|nr:hypothetical protein [Minwuia thermotolerans]PJK27447.1 hypothetical protein CVT23_21215 [Minwuia thermotolerans]
MANDAPKGGSLYLALDCADADPEAVEQSVLLAAREGRALVLVTVERADWAWAAGLSVTQLVRGHDLKTEAVDAGGMERMLGFWSARTEAVVAELARRHGVVLRQERRRGRLDIVLEQVLGADDWLSLVLPAGRGEREAELDAIARLAGAFGHPLMISPRQRRGRRPVLLLHGGGEAALARAILLASLRQSALKVWLRPGNAANADAIRRQAEAADVPVEIENVEEEGLLARLAAFDAAAIVLDRQGGASGGIDTASLLEARRSADICVV